MHYKLWIEEFLWLERGGFWMGWGPRREYLWRLENGELDDVNRKVIVLLAGQRQYGGDVRDRCGRLADSAGRLYDG